MIFFTFYKQVKSVSPGYCIYVYIYSVFVICIFMSSLYRWIWFMRIKMIDWSTGNYDFSDWSTRLFGGTNQTYTLVPESSLTAIDISLFECINKLFKSIGISLIKITVYWGLSKCIFLKNRNITNDILIDIKEISLTEIII